MISSNDRYKKTRCDNKLNGVIFRTNSGTPVMLRFVVFSAYSLRGIAKKSIVLQNPLESIYASIFGPIVAGFDRIERETG